ncbi:hypothetical protein BDN72DRAFT_623134 [Pluteus cervinus]|uniref:Uncharacterized protein n=1 Tax=Pluteus cervinus TaxID=181527 RepID=A0ACD3AV67_9AGAR|nr:hypothetical protein BDN72DRAFT_623134 [Pluteus cervinus]
MSAYPSHPRATIGRYRNRGAYDFQAIHSVVNAAPVLHLSFIPSETDPFPTIIPLLGQMGSFANPDADPSSEPLDLYIHTHASTRLVKLVASQTEDGEKGLPVCASAALVDGYVLALTPFNHSCNYRSAVLHGYATPVTDEAERLYAMELITNGLIPERWGNSRVPPTKTELQTTGILKVTIESASGKVRAAGAANDKQDLENEGVIGKVWTGVVPLWQTLGEPVSNEHNRVPVPAYLDNWRKEANERGEEYAVETARKKY